ncbi:MAG: hypothetical protein N2Z20_03355 [Elusimicrobiales bacterium]|nr:hypothetical protein [Elusimicrobiales bacterium]
MTAKKIIKFLKYRSPKISKLISKIIKHYYNFPKSTFIISYRTSITIPYDNEIDLDIHPIFKSKYLSDYDKKKQILLFINVSISFLKIMNFNTNILEELYLAIKKTSLRPFDIKICYSWDKESCILQRYTVYINYNSQKKLIQLLKSIIPNYILNIIKNSNILIDTIGIDMLINGNRRFKLYYRKKIENNENIFTLFKSKLTSVYLMKSFPDGREKNYIHFQNSINPKKFIRYFLNEGYNEIISNIVNQKVKIYFIGYSMKPKKQITLYLR